VRPGLVAALWIGLAVAWLLFLPWWAWLLGAALLVRPTLRAAQARRSEAWRPRPRKRDSAAP
jgi:hypothetical protein